MDLWTAVEKSIVANELGSDLQAAYRFSDPDGIHTGKSGWSFGIVQYDINNNPSAARCLAQCGFTPDEIAALKAQTIDDMWSMDARLREHKQIIDKWDDLQIDECLHHVQDVADQRGFKYADDFAICSAADYHNQIYMSLKGRLASFCAGLGRKVTGADIYALKMSIEWGQKRPDDVDRRYNNIARIFGRPLMHRGKAVK